MRSHEQDLLKPNMQYNERILEFCNAKECLIEDTSYTYMQENVGAIK